MMETIKKIILLGLGLSITMYSTTFALPRLGNGYDYNKYIGILEEGKYYLSDENITLYHNMAERNSLEPYNQYRNYSGYCYIYHSLSSHKLQFIKGNCDKYDEIRNTVITDDVAEIKNTRTITPEAIGFPSATQYIDINGNQKIALFYSYYDAPDLHLCKNVHTIPTDAKPLNIITNTSYSNTSGGGNRKANGIAYQSGDYIAFYHINSTRSCWTTVDTIDMNLTNYNNYIAGATIDDDGKIVGVVIGGEKQVLKAYDSDGNLYTKECNLNFGDSRFDLHKIKNPIYYIGKDYAYFVGYRTDVNELIEYKIDYDNCSITPIVSSSNFDIFYGETKGAKGNKVGVYALLNSGDLYYFDTSLNAHFLQSTTITNDGDGGNTDNNWKSQLTGVVDAISAPIDIKVDIQRARFFCSYTTGNDMTQACINACDTQEWQEYCQQCQTFGLPYTALSDFAIHCNININSTKNAYNTQDNITVKTYTNSGVVIYTKDDITACHLTNVDYFNCSLPSYNSTGDRLDKIGYFVDLGGSLISYPLCQAGNLLINLKELAKSSSKVAVVLLGDVNGIDNQIMQTIGNNEYYNFITGKAPSGTNASKMQAITIQYTLTLIHIVDIIVAIILLIAIIYYFYTKYKK